MLVIPICTIYILHGVLQVYLQFYKMLPDNEIIAAAHATHLPKADLEVLSPCVRDWRESFAVAPRPWAWEHSQHKCDGSDCT